MTTLNSPLITRQSLLAWPLVVPLLVYLPMVTVQRRLSEAVIVPLAILAVPALARLWARRRAWAVVMVTVLLMSSVFVWALTLFSAMSVARPAYRPAAELRAFAWMQANLPANAVVLGHFDTGNALPAYTDLQPYVGHGPETIGALAKTRTTEAFFGGMLTETDIAALMASVNIRYVFYGPLERALAPAGQGDEPAWAAGLTLLYDVEGYRVYGAGAEDALARSNDFSSNQKLFSEA